MRFLQWLFTSLIFRSSTQRLLLCCCFTVFLFIYDNMECHIVFFCCEWIMTQPQFQKFSTFSVGFFCSLLLLRRRQVDKNNANDNALRQMAVRWWMVIDAVRTYCGFCRLQPPNRMNILLLLCVCCQDFLLQLLSCSFTHSPAPFRFMICSFLLGFMLCFCALLPNVESFALAIAGVRGLPLALLKFEMMLWLFNFTSVWQLF